MKMRIHILSLLLCLTLALSLCACGSGAPAPAEASEPPAPALTEAPAVTADITPEPEPTPLYDRAAYDAAAEAIRDEFLQVREEGLDNFDEAAHPELPWYTAVLTRYPESSYYEGTYDFDGNGVPKLLIAMGNDADRNVVGVYAFDGRDMHYLCQEYALGERSHLSYTDGLFVVHGSGGASSGVLAIYRIAEDGWSTEIVDVIDYEYSDAGQVTYTSQLGVISPEELSERGLAESEGLDAEIEWSCFLRGEGQEALDMPNPWTEAASAEEAAAGAGLAFFTAPGTLEGFGPVRWAYRDGVAQSEYNSVNDQLLIRKSAGNTDSSGDDTEYPNTWIIERDGIEITCAGYGEEIHLARWALDGDSFSLTCNPGIEELRGLGEDVLTAIVGQVQ